MSELRIGILTSVETRHHYVVHRLRGHFDVAAVGYEETGYAPAKVAEDDLSPEEKRIVDHHFAERSRQERIYFGSRPGVDMNAGDVAVLHIAQGQLNSPRTLTYLDQAQIDLLVVYGTNLIKSPLLEKCSGRIVNLHLGLSPYYRGTATNFYPLFNEEPQYVGATIHLLDAGIDSGPIFRHARPNIVADDMPHTIGCKAIEAGVDALIEVLRDIADGTARSVPQWNVERPRLCLRKNFHPRQVVELYRKIDAGLIRNYVAHVKEVAQPPRLITAEASQSV